MLRVLTQPGPEADIVTSIGKQWLASRRQQNEKDHNIDQLLAVWSLLILPVIDYKNQLNKQ